MAVADLLGGAIAWEMMGYRLFFMSEVEHIQAGHQFVKPVEKDCMSKYLVYNVTERVHFIDKGLWVVPADEMLQSCGSTQCACSRCRYMANLCFPTF